MPEQEDGPGSRILLRSSDLNRGVRFHRMFPGMAACRGSAGWMIRARVNPRPEIQIEDTSGIWIVPARVPAARPLRRDRRSVSQSGLRIP
jgi:hypothetical protein